MKGCFMQKKKKRHPELAQEILGLKSLDTGEGAADTITCLPWCPVPLKVSGIRDRNHLVLIILVKHKNICLHRLTVTVNNHNSGTQMSFPPPKSCKLFHAA